MAKNKSYVINDEHLMSEWDWEDNKKLGFNPEQLTLGSGKKPSWICSKGHKWNTAVYHRAKRGTNCPYCSNQKILYGYNDLQSQYPDLMKEWDFEINTVSPSSVAVKSNKVVGWVCSKGHKYKKAIYKRTSGEDCPYCAKARATSFPEQCFFYYIKKYYPDAINRYREIFNNSMELDIYIPSINTGIEYDGFFWHGRTNEAQKRDEKKYQICKENNVRLFRIKEGTLTDFSETADRIWYIPKNIDNQALNFYILDFLKQLTFWSNNLPDINVERDKNEILEYKTLKLEKSLQYLHPDIASQWHPTKNGKLTPDMFVPGSAESVWWLCPKCGNEWKAPIVNRTKGHGCNICATPKRMVTRKENILLKRGSIDNELCLKDWDYEENEYGPDHYTNGSGAIVGWKCHKCGYKWKAAICDRTKKHANGCPLCSGKTIVSGVNDLQTLFPELMKEWDYEKNININPTKIGRGSRLKVFWKCQKCGYNWEAQVYNRANGKGCPCCAGRVVVPGINDLATTNPKLAAEWHPTLNVLKPTEVTKGQSKKAYWICSRCGYVWQDSLNHRSRGRGCKRCKNKI